MRIALDATAVPRQMAGAGVYTYQLACTLAKSPGDHELVVLGRPDLFAGVAGLRVVPVEPQTPARRLLWEQTLLPSLLERLDADVLHSPHHHTPLVGWRAVAGRGRLRRVVTFHDVTFLLLPQRYPVLRRLYMEAVTRTSARVADAIICPSQAVRRDIVDRLGVSPEQVLAIPEAAGPQYRPIDVAGQRQARERYHLPERFILSVGSLEPGKNRTRLIAAIARLRNQQQSSPLIVIGQPAWGYQRDFDLVERLGLRDQVRFLGYVPDSDMPAIYSAATVFAFPSLYEGFGLPVLEAMACGAPVITSAAGATAEVAGDAALLIDPRDTDAIASTLARGLSDGGLRADLTRKGFDRAAEFSWERTARETLSVYEVVAAKR